MRNRGFCLAALAASFSSALWLAAPLGAEAQERSFVGKKLPALAWADTEGHTIRPSDYEGSVFVMVTGIPW